MRPSPQQRTGAILCEPSTMCVSGRKPKVVERLTSGFRQLAAADASVASVLVSSAGAGTALTSSANARRDAVIRIVTKGKEELASVDVKNR